MYQVRGKRKRRSNATQPTGVQHVKRGRSLKRIEELAISRSHANARLREWRKESQSAVSSPEPSLSHLERLPNELIQQIFFQCFEISLPRTSVQLARALSTESTYTALILFAYFDDDDEHPVKAKLFRPVKYYPLQMIDRIRLQREILSCRWCTLERITNCLPMLCELTMLQAWHAEREYENLFRREVDVNPQTVPLEIEGIEGVGHMPSPEDSDGMARHFFAKTEIGSGDQSLVTLKTFEAYLPRIIRWCSFLDGEESGGKPTIWKKLEEHGKLSVIGARVLPRWLVMGRPWTQSKLELLQLLRQGFTFIQQDHVLEISASALFEGVASAIEEENVVALLTLLDLHNDVFRKSERSREYTMTPPTNHPLPAHLFRLATKSATQSSTIMWHLIRACADSIPRDDDLLTAWAVRKQVDGDQVADWLLQYMSGTLDCRNSHGAYCFRDGCLLWSDMRQRLPPAHESFAQQLNYLSGRTALLPTNMSGEPCG